MKKILALTLVSIVILATAACGSGGKEKLTSFSEPQEYVGEVEFDGSKKVVISFRLSADAKQITELKLSTEELILLPKTDNNSETKSEENEIEFKYSGESQVQSNMKIEQDKATGNNVVARDKSGNPIFESIVFTGGFENSSPIDLKNDKIVSDAMPLICDLTVTNTRIYGDIKLELRGFETKSVKAEFKNTKK
ncbi:MAG: hypothetical protein LBT27_03485 [Prevotellaceae bacterium]|jgi:hypothetical protein|nr:hypothetical protein [Prevotellaceae bacterium]